MVYRGKPSAGCENCRKAKKRCDLEQPTCSRCVKLRKPCSGYRDTTQLQIQDESEAVRQKALRSKARQAASEVTHMPTLLPSGPESPFGILTPGNSDTTSSSDSTIDVPFMDPIDPDEDFDFDSNLIADLNTTNTNTNLVPANIDTSWMYPLKTNPDDIAMNQFFTQFSTQGIWEHILDYARSTAIDSCLALAMRACGMASLGNLENVVMGRNYAQSMYVEALGLLNAALRDPKKCRTDDSLLAVTMLGYYENLTCNSRESIQSWKAHILGATQLLRVRGKQQFKTQMGRTLFRETRAQILTQCIWDDLEPPDFLLEWEQELQRQTTAEYYDLAFPGDDMTRISFDFARLRAKMLKKEISDVDAAAEASRLDAEYIRWSIETPEKFEVYRYHDVEVLDSPHVWNGVVHSYSRPPVPSVWNTLRLMRIMLSRTQEQLCHQFDFSAAERAEQKQYFRKVRRQMLDEICAAVPCCLGHAAPVYNVPCTLISAYGAIWPLFFAGTCALERVGMTVWQQTQGHNPTHAQTSAASVQAAWILSQMDYISEKMGIRWAKGIAAVLKGDFRLHDNLLPDGEDQPLWVRRVETTTRRPRFLLQSKVIPTFKA